MWVTDGRELMTSRILKSILSVATVVLLSSLLVITGVLYQYFGNIQKAQLRDELSLVAKATESLGKEYLTSVDSTRYRLTWIDAEGNVLFDSHAEPEEMENHGDREEIEEALTSGEGSSVRHSTTLTEKTIYEAISLSDGTILRISVSSASALALILDLIQPIAFVAIGAIILSIWLARAMAKQVVEPLNELDLETPLNNDVYEELTPLLFRIHEQQTEIKSQVLSLKQKQEEFDTITGNMNEALVLLDHTGRILSINPAAKKLFNANSSCIGEDFLIIDRKQDMCVALEEAKANGKSVFRETKDGKVYQFDLSSICPEGSLQGLVILAYDITDQVNAEQNRREFTANISHELKTPLQSIIGSSELIENGIVKQEDLPRFIGHIRKEATRLVSLIEDIIRLSLLDSKPEMEKEEVSLHELSEEVLEVLADAANMKQISMNVCGKRAIVYGVRRLLYEIIYNLCDNAIKYNEPGGRVDISFSEEGENIILTVQDTGIGIAPEHQEKVFERFYRVDKSHSKQSGGTGLGLSIVKHAVQYLDGKLMIKSELGKGTSISVILRSK